MEQNSELYNKKAQRVFHELSKTAFSFLDTSTLMQALTVSTEFHSLISDHLKSLLLANNLISSEDVQLNSEDYIKLFRGFYSREILVAPLSSAKQSYNELQFARQPGFSTAGIKDFSVGNKFTVFHLYNNDMVFLKSDEYFNPLFEMKEIDPKNVKKNVAKFSTSAKDLFYMTSTGHLHAILFNADRPSNELTEVVLDCTLINPLQDFAASYSHAVLVSRPAVEQNNQDESNKTSETIYYLNIQDITAEDFNSPARVKLIEGLEGQQIESICVGSTVAYFVGDTKKVYESDFSVPNNDKFQAFPVQALSSKAIKKVWSGLNHYFAMEQDEIQSIETWDQKDIIQWATKSKDFEEYANILKYENITGKELIEADKSFLVERLGMMRDDLQVKFLNEIERFAKKTYKKPQLYAWGNNGNGQLGLNAGHVVIAHPTAVVMPEFDKDEQIEHIECGLKNTAILTTKGNVWITELLPKKIVKKEEKEQGEEEQPRGKGGKNSTKSKRKESPESPKENKNNKSTAAGRWLNVTSMCETQKDGKQYRIIKVSISKDHFAVLGAEAGISKNAKRHVNKAQTQDEEEKLASTKFKGADLICDRLHWDKSLNADEFVVGYEDRFLGILEIPFREFTLKTDIPTHRVKFFKRRGEVVWDRVLKINKI